MSDEKAISDLLAGQARILAELKGVNRAFPLNDLGEPDIDGHRQDHLSRIDEAKTENDNKHEAVKGVVKVAAGGFATILFYALVDYVKVHLK